MIPGKLLRRPLLSIVTSLALFWITAMVLNIQDQELDTRNTHVVYNKNDGGRPKFRDFGSRTRFTRTFHTVCITHRNVPTELDERCSKVWFAKNRTYEMHCRVCHHKQKLITVYQENGSFFGLKNISSVGYDISFKSERQLPHHYTVIKNQTAYFLGPNGLPNEPDNFFHFTKQIYFPLYWLIKSTNQLHEGANNAVYYSAPYGLCDRDTVHYYDPNKFKYFRDILHIMDNFEFSAFVDKPLPNNICYRNAVFSTELFTDKAKDAISHFKKSLKITDNVCKSKILTIINRSNYRRILNAAELKEIGEELGYDTRVVYMEKLSLAEQAQLIHCTRVLVGVAGAGLQWAFFMQDHSGVIEIAWPDMQWHFFFTGTGLYQSGQRDVIRPLKFEQLRAKCHLNPPAVNIYAKDIFRKETNFSYQESLEILQMWRNYFTKPVMSVGKLCDITVDPEEFRTAVTAAGKRDS